MKKFVNYIMQTKYNDIKVYFDKKHNTFVGRQIGKNYCKQVLYYKNGDNKSGSKYMFYPIKYVIKCFGFECPVTAMQECNGYYDKEQKIYVLKEHIQQIKHNFKTFIKEHISGKRYLTTLKKFEKQ